MMAEVRMTMEASSAGKSLVVVEDGGAIAGGQGASDVGGTPAADLAQILTSAALGTAALFALQIVMDGAGYGLRSRGAAQAGEFGGHAVGGVVFDVEAHPTFRAEPSYTGGGWFRDPPVTRPVQGRCLARKPTLRW